MYSTVLLVPWAVTVMGLEVMGLPLPKRPIWLKGAGLQEAGRQTAVMLAAPGKTGVTAPAPAPMVWGVVERNSRARPVMGTWLVS